ncbi:MAG: hypothetical protein KGO94_10660 [Alphaproteobacteria bacterium]|nr:hypothetical protein [Alphaproteobacteria bacterium]
MRSLFSGFIIAMIFTSFGLFALGVFAAKTLFRQPPLRFQAGGYSFLVPEGWSCGREGTETVCHPKEEPLKRRALLVATAKIVGPNDNLDYFRAYLSTPTKPAGTPEKPLVDELLSLTAIHKNDLDWVVAERRNSELPGWITRYFAVRSGALSVLFTVSGKAEIYGQVKPVSDTMFQNFFVRKLS